MQRVTEERDALLARVSEMERAKQAVDVATEFGVHEWADELAKDEDTRAMRAHAQRIRDRLGRTSPGMDGGVRGMGVPPSPQGMDDMIRAGVRRQ
jgi:acetylornithine deacetylase/succinyl-diaminopimelate desuccinylase-like protein